MTKDPSSVRRRAPGKGPGDRPHLRVGLCVFPITADAERNFAAMERLTQEAAAKGARLVVFAEGALSGYYGEQFRDESAIDLKQIDHLTRELGRLARETGVFLVAGTLLRDGAARFNSLVAFSPCGRRVARYDKRHLTSQDHRFYARGETPPALFRVEGWTVGLLLCFDARFPVWAHEYARRGADVMIYSFNMCGKKGLWKRDVMEGTLRARAGENDVFVLSVNDGRSYPQLPTMAVDRGGCTIARAFPTRPTVVLADLDPAVTYRIEEEIRREQPVDYPVALGWGRKAERGGRKAAGHGRKQRGEGRKGAA